MCATTRRKKALTNQNNLRLEQKQPEPKPRNQVRLIILLLNSITVLQIKSHHPGNESKTPNAYSEILKLCISMVVPKLASKPGGKIEESQEFVAFSPTVQT